MSKKNITKRHRQNGKGVADLQKQMRYMNKIKTMENQLRPPAPCFHSLCINNQLSHQL